MKREGRDISGKDAYKYACDWYDISKLDFEIEPSILDSSDDEDGGGSYTLILKEKSTGKYFTFGYRDWDIDNTDYDEDEDEIYGRCDMGTHLTEVFAEQVIKVEYR